MSTILDLYDRKIVAYKISNFNYVKLVIATLNEAITKRKTYLELSFTVIKATSIHLMESFFAILKKETLYNNDIANSQEYIALVEE